MTLTDLLGGGGRGEWQRRSRGPLNAFALFPNKMVTDRRESSKSFDGTQFVRPVAFRKHARARAESEISLTFSAGEHYRVKRTEFCPSSAPPPIGASKFPRQEGDRGGEKRKGQGREGEGGTFDVPIAQLIAQMIRRFN